MGFLVSLIKTFKNGLQRKLEDRTALLELKQEQQQPKQVKIGQASCEFQRLPEEKWRRERKSHGCKLVGEVGRELQRKRARKHEVLEEAYLGCAQHLKETGGKKRERGKVLSWQFYTVQPV